MRKLVPLLLMFSLSGSAFATSSAQDVLACAYNSQIWAKQNNITLSTELNRLTKPQTEESPGRAILLTKGEKPCDNCSGNPAFATLITEKGFFAMGALLANTDGDEVYVNLQKQVLGQPIDGTEDAEVAAETVLHQVLRFANEVEAQIGRQLKADQQTLRKLNESTYQSSKLQLELRAQIETAEEELATLDPTQADRANQLRSSIQEKRARIAQDEQASTTKAETTEQLLEKVTQEQDEVNAKIADFRARGMGACEKLAN